MTPFSNLVWDHGAPALADRQEPGSADYSAAISVGFGGHFGPKVGMYEKEFLAEIALAMFIGPIHGSDFCLGDRLAGGIYQPAPAIFHLLEFDLEFF